MKALFSEPFGGGYPKSDASRKISDANRLKEIRISSQINFKELLGMFDEKIGMKIRTRIDRINKQ